MLATSAYYFCIACLVASLFALTFPTTVFKTTVRSWLAFLLMMFLCEILHRLLGFSIPSATILGALPREAFRALGIIGIYLPMQLPVLLGVFVGTALGLTVVNVVNNSTEPEVKQSRVAVRISILLVSIVCFSVVHFCVIYLGERQTGPTLIAPNREFEARPLDP